MMICASIALITTALWLILVILYYRLGWRRGRLAGLAEADRHFQAEIQLRTAALRHDLRFDPRPSPFTIVPPSPADPFLTESTITREPV